MKNHLVRAFIVFVVITGLFFSSLSTPYIHIVKAQDSITETPETIQDSTETVTPTETETDLPTEMPTETMPVETETVETTEVPTINPTSDLFINETHADTSGFDISMQDTTALNLGIPRDESLYFNGQQWGTVVCWNPYSSNCNNAMAIAQQDNPRLTMFETPYMYNMLDDQDYPLLADGPYSWNSGETELTFHIKSAAKWSDGTAVTADDVAYTWRTNILYGTSISSAYSDYIDSIEAINSTTVLVKAKLDGDGHTVNPLMVESYLSSAYVIQKAWTQTLETRSGGDSNTFLNDAAEDVVYSGPYHKDYSDDSVVVLIRNDNYWGKSSSMWGKLPVPKYLVHFIYPTNDAGQAAFEAGYVDVSQQFISNEQDLWLTKGLPISTYLADAPYQIGASLPTAFYNLKSFGLDNVNVRKAIAMAVNYDTIVANAMSNQSATFDQFPRSLMNPTPAEQALYDSNDTDIKALQFSGNDIDGAKALLDASGIVDSDSDGWRDIDGQDLSYTVTCPNGWNDWQAAAEVIASVGSQIGIQMTTNYPEWEEYQNIVTNWSQLPTSGYDIFIMFTDGAGSAQPWGRINKLLNSRFAQSDNNWNGNWGGYSNSSADAYINAIPSMNDANDIKAAYTSLVKIYLTDVPSFTLMYRPQSFQTVNESVWTNFPRQGDGTSPAVPPLDLTDGYSIAGLYNLVSKAAFDKIGPEDQSDGQRLPITLSWQSTSRATSYSYCYNTSKDCTNWIDNGTSTEVTLSNLADNTTYYWQVKAISNGSTIYADGDATDYWSFTTMPDLNLPRNETLSFNGQQWGTVVCWNPYSSNCNNAMAIAQQDNPRLTMFETPYMYNMLDNQDYPLLADGPYSWNSGQTELTFHIKSAAKWSDGTAVTANDVAYTWQTNILYGTSIGSAYSDYIDSIEAVDSTTVLVKAKLDGDGHAVSPLMVESYLSSAYVIQKAWTQTLETRSGGDSNTLLNDAAKDVVYSGPYHKYFSDDSEVVLVRDNNYWGQDSSMWGKLPAPKYLVHFIYPTNDAGQAAFESGDIDVSQQFISNEQDLWLAKGLPVSTYLADAPYQVGASLPTAFYNLKSFGLDNVNVRKAIAMAVNYDTIVANAMSNQSATFDQFPRSLMNPTPAEQALYDSNDTDIKALQFSGNDIDGAKTLLDAAGIVDSDSDGWRDIDGQDLSYTVTCPNGWNDWQAAAEVIASVGSQIGIQMTTNYPEWSEYQNIVTNWSQLPTSGYDIFIMFTDGAGSAQPWGRINKLLNSRFAQSDNNWNGNWGGYSNSSADAYINAIPSMNDVNDIKAAYTSLVKIYLTDVPSFTLMYRPQSFQTVNESVWTNFPRQGDGTSPAVPPLDLTDGYSIAGLYNLKLTSGFLKTSPVNSATNQSTKPTLSWEAVDGAISYSYCINTTSSCSNWQGNGTSTSISLPLLDNNTTYYWQVKAFTHDGIILGNNSAFWSFTTAPIPFLSTIQPIASSVDHAPFTLTITGTGFIPTSMIKWNDTVLNTTFVSSTKLTAQVDSSLLSDAGSITISVDNSEFFGGASNTTTLPIISYSPLKDAKLDSSKVTFSWDSIPGADSYTIQLSLSNTISSPVLNTTTTSTTYTYSTALTNGKTYYWRIRPHIGSSWGDWLDVWNFSSLNPPAAPVLTSPASSAMINDNTPEFSWQPSLDGNSYKIQISKVSTFNSPLVSETLDSSILSFTPSKMDDGTYYWRVCAIDSVGVTGAWSSTRQFTLDTVPQAVPALSAPADSALILTNLPTLTVASVSGANRYQFQVNDSNDFSTPLVEAIKTTTSITLTSSQGLPFGTIYWRVQSLDAAGNESGWSASRTFVVNNLKTPANASFTTDTTPTFTWSAISGSLGYKIQVATDDAFTTDVVAYDNLPVSTSYTPTTPLGLNKWYWRLSVKKSDGSYSNWTPAFQFTVTLTPPLPPVLALPATAAITNDNTPDLSWTASISSSAVSYQVQISKITSFTITEQDEIVTLTSFTASTLSDGIHYWRVRTLNDLDVPGAWSSSRSFTVDTVKPSVPVLSLPKEGAILLTNLPTLTVASVTGANRYQFQVNDSNDFYTPRLYATKTTTSFTLGTGLGLPFGTIYWRVQSLDAAGNESGWSASHTFVVNNLKTPANTSFTTDTTPTFAWSAISGALGYKIQVATDDAFTTDVVAYDNLPVSTSYTPATPLGLNKWFWRLSVKKSDGSYSNWTPAFQFTVTLTPPLPPVLALPAAAAITNDNTPDLSWTASISPSAVSYQVQISKITSFTITEQDEIVTATSFTASALSDGTHYWRVRSLNDLDVPGAWSSSRSFTVDTLPPSKPVLSLPKEGAIVMSNLPTLTVASVTGANRYQFQVNDSNDFYTPLLYATKTTTSFTLGTGLGLPFGTIYWRAQSLDAAGNPSGWSDSRTFVVNNLKTPANASFTTDTTPTFTWSAISGALGYKIQVATDDAFTTDVVAYDNLPVSTSYTPTTPLGLNKWYWRLSVKKSDGSYSNWTPAFQFTVTLTPPLPPVLALPATAAITNDNTPDLSWTASISSSAVSYQVQISKITSFTITEQDEIVAATSFTASALSDGTHYWRVRSLNDLDVPGAWSSSRSFTVDTFPPSVPVLSSPKEGAILLTHLPTLTVGAVSGANRYEFQVNTSNDFSSPLLDVTKTTTSFTLGTGQSLPSGTIYWRVQSLDAAGNSSGWSDPRTFTIQ